MVPHKISVGDAKINVVPRRNEERRLLHLVNMVPGTAHEDFRITLSRQFAGAIDRATLYAPGRETAALRSLVKERFTEMSIPYLKEWCIITLHESGKRGASSGN